MSVGLGSYSSSDYVSYTSTAGSIQYLLGKNCTVSITPQDISAGVWTDNAIGTLTFLGRLDSDKFSQTINTEDFSSVSSWNDNPIPISYSGLYTITEIMEALPLVTSHTQFWGVGNYLEVVAETSLYNKIVCTINTNNGLVGGVSQNDSVTIRTWTMYCLLVGIDRDSPKEKNILTATFKTVAVGNGTGGFINNPTLS